MPWLERRLGNCNRNGKMDCASIVVIHTHLNTNRSCLYIGNTLGNEWWVVVRRATAGPQDSSGRTDVGHHHHHHHQYDWCDWMMASASAWGAAWLDIDINPRRCVSFSYVLLIGRLSCHQAYTDNTRNHSKMLSDDKDRKNETWVAALGEKMPSRRGHKWSTLQTHAPPHPPPAQK